MRAYPLKIIAAINTLSMQINFGIVKPIASRQRALYLLIFVAARIVPAHI